MKAQSMNWSINQTQSNTFGKSQQGINRPDPAAVRRAVSSAVESATRHLVRDSVATMVAVTILIAAVWASEILAASGIIQAIIWASSFVFLALAVEANATSFKPLLATGLSLGILALLSSPESTGFTILAAVLIAAWSAWAILQGWEK